MMKNIIIYKNIIQEVLSLSFPMMVTQLIAIGSGFLSLAMMGRLGHDVLAASALIFSTRISILLTCSSILFSLSILVGHAFGEKEYRKIGNFVQQGWFFAALLSMPVMIVFWNIQPILIHLGQEKSITQIVRDFFHANIWNVVPFMLSICNQQLLYGIRKQKIDMIANILAVCVLMLFAYIFIYGGIGVPALGVKGLGYAMDLQGWFYFIFTSMIILSNPFFKIFGLIKFQIQNRWSDFVKMVTVGWPIALQIGGEMLSMFVLAAMVGWLGADSLAAYQIVTQYFFLVMVPLFALSQASGVLIGIANGEKNKTKIKMLGNTSVAITLIITLLVAAIFLSVPSFLASLYLDTNNPSNQVIMHYVRELFIIFAILQVFDALRNVLTGSLRGLFDTRYPMIVGLSVIWLIGIPSSYVLAFKLNLGIIGIAMGSIVGIFTGLIILFYRWRRFVMI